MDGTPPAFFLLFTLRAIGLPLPGDNSRWHAIAPPPIAGRCRAAFAAHASSPRMPSIALPVRRYHRRAAAGNQAGVASGIGFAMACVLWATLTLKRAWVTRGAAPVPAPVGATWA